MKIMLCGGGTGGHITPILAIAHEIKKLQPDTRIIFVGKKGDKFGHLVEDSKVIDEIHTIKGGKFRRYHGESWPKKVTDVKTNLLNIRDVFHVSAGYLQSRSLIKRLKPDAIFIKGGDVGVPIGLAAASKHIPYITHDSDALPSLTTKIIGKWAAYNATGMPEELYDYPKHKTRFVGVPVASEFEYVNEQLKQDYRNDLNIPSDAKLLTVIGGSLGADRLNKIVSEVVQQLFDQVDNLYVIHQVGKGKVGIYKGINFEHLIVKEFITDLYKYTGAADVVLSRSGATSIAELAIQAKATLLIPNPQLTGGHQVKNAQMLASKGAAIVLSEKELLAQPTVLASNLVELLNDTSRQIQLSNNLHKEAFADSASKIGVLLLSIAKQKA